MRANQVKKLKAISEQQKQRPNVDIIFTIRCRKNYNFKKIQQKHKNFKISVSHTTRKPRSNEVEGVDYFFISKDNFEKKLKITNFMNMQKFSIITMEHQKISMI